MRPTDDTIAAIATAPAGAYRGVVRVSGPDVATIVAACFVSESGFAVDSIRIPTVRRGEFRARDAMVRLPTDLYYWPNERSYTRQPSAEFHLPGSPPLLNLALGELTRWGARIADPGEFTARAFLSGRLDLTQAEAVLGVIQARHSEDLKVALAQLAGGLSAPLASLREDLLGLLAHVEAELDFAEEDLEFISRAELVSRLNARESAIRGLLERVAARDDQRPLPSAVLIGPPNAGKSRLFNALVGEDRAIVSERAGATRDYLSATVKRGDFLFELIDTAGRDWSSDELDDFDGADQAANDPSAVAARIAIERRFRADLTILCVDSTQDGSAPRSGADCPADWLVVTTKGDAPRRLSRTEDELLVSSVTGRGLDRLLSRVKRALVGESYRSADMVASTGERCRDHLSQALAALERAKQSAQEKARGEILAMELREALTALGEVAGAAGTEDVLDRVFSQFCVGK